MKVGDKVIIKECHKMPDLVGKEAKVLSMADPEIVQYPVLVMLPEPMILKLETPFGPGEVHVAGPFPFREDELEVMVAKDIPDEFKKAFEDDKSTPNK
jgi:hypothetical protein